jgi:hypothetical protein
MQPEPTSISDIPAYRELCRRAADDLAVFHGFRSHPTYAYIVETAVPEVGQDYGTIALETLPAYRGMLDEFRRNDGIGGPPLVRYPGFGVFAPNTLRYVKHAADIERHFEPLAGKRVAEIGAGYGGLCRILSTRFADIEFHIFDLPEALALAERYLDLLGVRGVYFHSCFDPIRLADVDLVISSYAFSELNRTEQDRYLDGVVVGARAGFIHYGNVVATGAERSHAVAAIEARIPQATVNDPRFRLGAMDVHCGISLITWGGRTVR